MHLGIIIQARMSATRFPGKVLRPFSDGCSLLDIITNGMVENLPNQDFVIATTDNIIDDAIADFAAHNNLNCFRGSESNVLKRFCDCSSVYNYSHIIRVCADNPFLDFAAIKELADYYVTNANQFDYCSYRVLGKPAILTHFGFWAELISVSALERVRQMTNEARFLEHVTNYIYGNPEFFDVRWIELNEEIYCKGSFRFTIDSLEDFQIVDFIRSNLSKNTSQEKLMKFVLQNPNLLKSMAKSIEKHGK